MTTTTKVRHAYQIQVEPKVDDPPGMRTMVLYEHEDGVECPQDRCLQHLECRPQPTVARPKVALFDLDGTLALHDGRKPYEYEKCDTDLPNQTIIDILHALEATHFVDGIIFASGREATGTCREKTKAWLQKYVGISGPLFMRREKDYRKDFIVKREMYENLIRPQYEVAMVFDDRDSVVSMWRAIGLTCLQVADGNF